MRIRRKSNVLSKKTVVTNVKPFMSKKRSTCAYINSFAKFYVASMGIVLDTAKIYPLEIAIMAVVFVISVLPTVVCTVNMSKKDGINE